MFESRRHSEILDPDTTPSQDLATGVQSLPGRINRLCFASPCPAAQVADRVGRTDRVPVLRMIEGYGLVTLKKNVREIEPVALAIEFKVMLG